MGRPMTGLGRLAPAVAVMLVACGTGGAADGRTVLTLSVPGDPADADAFRALVDAFEQRAPGIRVELDVVARSADQVAKLATAFSGGSPPDLFLMNFRRFGQFAARGVLEPLGPLAEASGAPALDGFYPQALDAFRYRGEQLCLPQNISSLVVYYNETLFADAGLAPPADDWDWQAFLAAARALTRDTDGDGQTDVYGLGLEPNLIRLAPFVWQHGGEVVDSLEQPTRTTLLDRTAIEAVTFFINLRRVHRVAPSQPEVAAEDLETRFASGRLGMILESRRFTPTLREVADLAWDVAPLPRDRTAATMLHSDAYCLARASQVKDAALQFVAFALGADGAPIIARTGRTVPSLRAVAESDAFLTPGERPSRARVWLDQIPLIRRTPVLGTWNEIEERADVIVEEWFFGPEPPEALGVEIDIVTRELFANPDLA